MSRIDNIKEWFESYVASFCKEEADFTAKVLLKKKHTLLVLENIINLAKSIDLDQDNSELAECCAILHDVGRFEQVKRYNSFSDSKTINHALLGVEIIEELNVLKEYSEEEKALILSAIEKHNMLEIPKISNADEEILVKLLRDADKLDIYRVVTSYYTELKRNSNQGIELELPDKPAITKKIFDSLMKEKAVNYKYLETLADFKLLQMSWVFDINFKKSYKIIYDKDYINTIYETMSKTDEVIEVHRKVKIFLENNL